MVEVEPVALSLSAPVAFQQPAETLAPSASAGSPNNENLQRIIFKAY
jgi:hypothetical protein